MTKILNKKQIPTVNSHNEWDRLLEVIVGIVDFATVPEWHVQLRSTMPEKYWKFYQKNGGQPFPKEQVQAAKDELEEFVHILTAEGVKVRRPDPIDFTKPFSTLFWNSKGGMYAAMPRDVLLVIGNEIIEAPMSWRSRYFEAFPYRSLIQEYFKKGAKWVSGPKPMLTDELYNYDFGNGNSKYSITEAEPVFEAASFMRCGRDIFVEKDNCTNDLGIEWLRRHLGETYKIHEIEVIDSHPMHIDTTFVPLAPGKLLIHGDRVQKVPEMFKKWDIFIAPEPCIPKSHCLYMTSRWLNMNLLMLDEKRVIVERGEERMIKALKSWGFNPIPCSFRNFNTFGGSFHCATLDVRRDGELKSYF